MSVLRTLSHSVKPLEPVAGSAAWASRPWLPSAELPQGLAGMLVITDQTYMAIPLGELPADGGPYHLDGFRLVKGDGRVYDVNLRAGSCDCEDGTFRPNRPGGCRHQAALRVLLPLAGIDPPASAFPLGRSAMTAERGRSASDYYRHSPELVPGYFGQGDDEQGA